MTKLPPELQEMLSHIEGCDGVFRPSEFWNYFDDHNISQLISGGIENFKRTINQNYYNWLPTDPSDNQFKSLLRLSAEHASADAFLAEFAKDDAFVESVFEQAPLGSRAAKEIYRLFVGMLWEHARKSSPNGLTEVLEEPTLGNPIPITLHGKRISQDLANSIRERNAIFSGVESEIHAGNKQTIVEIGAGYGRLAYAIVSSAPCRYIIVDIPPALYVSQWYLSNIFSEKNVFRFHNWKNYDDVKYKFDKSDIAFVTPDQFAKIPDNYFDIGIAISNLAEMTRAQVESYLRLFDDKVKSFVYIKQWISSENTLDKQIYTKSDFDLPRNWNKSFDRTDHVQDRFFETLWLRSQIAMA